MNNKYLIAEMSHILGRVGDGPAAPVSYEPREVIGTFAVQQNISVLDEALLESVAQLTWEQIGDIALLGTLSPTDFKVLEHAYDEGTREFRMAWQTLADDNRIGHGLDRGAFVMLSKICPTTESRSRYVEWCVKSIKESGPAVQAEAKKRTNLFAKLIPAGTPQQHYQNVSAAKKALMPAGVDANPENRPSIADVNAAEKAMDKIAAAKGTPTDELFINQKVDLDRERIKTK